MWKVVTSSNLNLPLKLFFYSPILTNNNLLLKIYCKNIVVVFFNYGFFFFKIFFLSFHFHQFTFHFFFFFFLLFSSTQVSTPHSFIFLFHLKNIPSTHLLHMRERERERERERGLLVRRPTAGGDRGRQKDKAGGD